MPIKKIGTLQIESEAASQSTLFWQVQTIVLIILGLFLALAFLGFTGPGFLSPKHIQNTNHTFSITYDPFIRQNVLNTLRIEVRENTSNLLQIFFPADYLQNVEMKQITPTPLKVEFQDNKIIYSFLSNSKDYQINFFFEPLTIGKSGGSFGKVGSDPVIITQWIYP